MDITPPEEQKIASHTLKDRIHKKARELCDRLKKLTLLEIIGLLAILLLIITRLFDFNLTARKKPWVNDLFSKVYTSIVGSQPALLNNASNQNAQNETDAALRAQVLPAEGVELPAVWGDLGRQMVKAGVIDQKKFESIYAQRGGLDSETKQMLLGSGNGKIKVTRENAQAILNLLWALGLGNQNEILEIGEMSNPQYGGAGNFASTGGWSLAAGDAMDHYSKHSLVKLTSDQQALVDKVSRGIYRPCCGNSAHFPDCNHGMAMLGLLELMASQNASEQGMWEAALAVNAFWFPETYLTIAKYLKEQGSDWSSTPPEVLLGVQYSSGPGYQQILKKVTPATTGGGGSCGV